jgi:hypothetical protein
MRLFFLIEIRIFEMGIDLADNVTLSNIPRQLLGSYGITIGKQPFGILKMS